MKPFTKNELIGVSIILLIIISVSLFNFGVAKRRGRDAQRKSDIGAIADALNKFGNDFGVFPQTSPDGKIVACKGEQIEKEEEGGGTTLVYALAACEWGKDALRDVNDPAYPSYIDSLPIEPQNKEGVNYIYLSNGKRFQILASLEGKDEDEYEQFIEAREISCGTRLCNFGRSSGTTPLDKSIEEYENKLMELEEKSKW